MRSAGKPLLIAQITDLHVGFDGDAPDERNSERCRGVIKYLRALNPQPDMVIATGDLTERGDEPSYCHLAEMLAPLSMPVHLMVGNHDSRAAMLRTFSEISTADGFVQSVVEAEGLRIILLDTLEQGQAGGGFCERRAEWLEARLAEAPAVPTVIALHHPPFVSGTDWMDPLPDAPWIERLRVVVAPATQVIALLAGHLHQSVSGMFAGRPCLVASSVAPQIALDLRSSAVAVADGRALIVEAPPALVLHSWTSGGLASHPIRIEAVPVLARFEQHTRQWLDRLRLENGSRDRHERVHHQA